MADNEQEHTEDTKVEGQHHTEEKSTKVTSSKKTKDEPQAARTNEYPPKPTP